MRIDTQQAFNAFEEECLNPSLENGHRRTRKDFFLFRGAPEPFELLSSLQRDLKITAKKTNWQEEIKPHERSLLNRFRSEIEVFRELKNQYAWFVPPQPRTDTFWYLSVMQHFGAPTRLCDFTADFWMAIFFAIDRSDGRKDLGFYRLRCNDCDETGNKLPRDREGKPWPRKDMNQFLGYLIDYGELRPTEDDRKRLETFFHSEKEINSYGWDKPYFENARLKKQKGFFVYNVDITKPLESDLSRDENNFHKFEIAHDLYPYLKHRLDEKELVRWKAYLDLEMAFEDFKSKPGVGSNVVT